MHDHSDVFETGYARLDNPSLTILVSLLLAFPALAAFVGVVHRTTTDRQADQIIHRNGPVCPLFGTEQQPKNQAKDRK